MKKYYIKPEMQIVWLRTNFSLLTASETHKETSSNPALAPESSYCEEE